MILFCLKYGGVKLSVLEFEKPSYKLSVVYLSDFLSQSEKKEAQDFFNDLIKIRQLGYCSSYPKGFVPVDTTDFVAELYLIYLEQNGEQKVISCLRQLPLSRLDYHKLDCPLFSTIKESGSTLHLKFLESFLKECKQKDTEVVYSSRFTIDPSVKDKKLRTEIKEIMASITYLDQIKSRSITMTGCVPKYKTDFTFKKWGYDFVKHNNQELPSFEKVSAGKEEIKLMYMLEGSDYGKSCFEKHRILFEKMRKISTEEAVHYVA